MYQITRFENAILELTQQNQALYHIRHRACQAARKVDTLGQEVDNAESERIDKGATLETIRFQIINSMQGADLPEQEANRRLEEYDLATVAFRTADTKHAKAVEAYHKQVERADAYQNQVTEQEAVIANAEATLDRYRRGLERQLKPPEQRLAEALTPDDPTRRALVERAEQTKRGMAELLTQDNISRAEAIDAMRAVINADNQLSSYDIYGTDPDKEQAALLTEADPTEDFDTEQEVA